MGVSAAGRRFAGEDLTLRVSVRSLNAMDTTTTPPEAPEPVRPVSPLAEILRKKATGESPFTAVTAVSESSLRQRVIALTADNNQLAQLVQRQAALLHGTGGRWSNGKLVAESVDIAQAALRIELRQYIQQIADAIERQRKETDELATAKSQVADVTSQLDAERLRAAELDSLLQERTRNNESLKRTIADTRARLDEAQRGSAALATCREILSLQTLILAQNGDEDAKAAVDSTLVDLRRVVAKIEAQLPP